MGRSKQVNRSQAPRCGPCPGAPTAHCPRWRRDRPIDHGLDGRFCAFCEQRYLDTTRRRLGSSARAGWHTLTGLTAEELFDTVAQFRLIANLFGSSPVDYWRLNHGLEFSGWRSRDGRTT